MYRLAHYINVRPVRPVFASNIVQVDTFRARHRLIGLANAGRQDDNEKAPYGWNELNPIATPVIALWLRL